MGLQKLTFWGDKEAALELLEPALARAGAALVSLAAADRILNTLRDDPRIQALLAAAQKRVSKAEAD